MTTAFILAAPSRSTVRNAGALGYNERVEDTIRFVKQSYRLEHMRLLDYQRLKNMASLVVAVAYSIFQRWGYSSPVSRSPFPFFLV